MRRWSIYTASWPWKAPKTRPKAIAPGARSGSRHSRVVKVHAVANRLRTPSSPLDLKRRERMASVLEGVSVIDFGQYIAGPLAGMLLADQGADVIRVDPPGGPMWDTPANATWNRGKRSITLNLKQPDDVATAMRLIEAADVVLENFRPGVMARLGLGPQAASRVNPRLIYCSLPGFAS